MHKKHKEQLLLSVVKLAKDHFSSASSHLRKRFLAISLLQTQATSVEL